MEKEKVEKIKKPSGEDEVFAYRVGEKLLCPACRELNVKILAVHEIYSTPSKAIKRGDIEGFVCDQCKVIKGDYRIQSLQELRDLQAKLEIPDKPEKKKPGERRGRKQDDFSDLQEMVEDVFSKVHFIEDFFTHNVPNEELFSDPGKSGFYHFLIDLEEDIAFTKDGMEMMDGRRDRKDRDPVEDKITDTAEGFLETIYTARAAGKI
jgi:hypothetical protein